jgi:hypothetical protein
VQIKSYRLLECSQGSLVAGTDSELPQRKTPDSGGIGLGKLETSAT